MSHPRVKDSRSSEAPVSRWPRLRQSPLALLLNLPRELRDLIYEHYGVDWSSINGAMRSLEDDVESVVFKDRTRKSFYYNAARETARHLPDGIVSLAPRSTPHLLLICRQVTDEALDFLHKKPLTVGPPLALVPGMLWPLQVTAFISSSTLRCVRHLVLDPDDRGRSWCDSKAMGYRSYIYQTEDRPSNRLYGRCAFAQYELDDLRTWLWGFRDALKDSTALQSVTVRFRAEHRHELRHVYYRILVSRGLDSYRDSDEIVIAECCQVSELVRHLPLVDVILPEDDDSVAELLCDVLTTDSRVSAAVVPNYERTLGLVTNATTDDL